MALRRLFRSRNCITQLCVARALSSQATRGVQLTKRQWSRAKSDVHFEEECEAGQVPWKRGSMSMPTLGAGVDCDQFIRDEIERFKPMRPRPLTMDEILDMLEPARIAKFLHAEIPIRYAERIGWIEDIPDWEQITELAEVHERHVNCFKAMRLVDRQADLTRFTEVVRETVESQESIQFDLARAMHNLHAQRGEDFGSAFANPWLDKFFLNCIGTETLMNQYLACVTMAEGGGSSRAVFSGGVINPECDVAQVCRDTSELVLDICEQHMKRVPMIKTEVFSERGIPVFSYIPGFLKFIMTEVLKNSCRATVELVKSDRELQKRPINVIVCADEHNVAIRVVDRARGIPFEVGDKVWSYLYSTGKKGNEYGSKATALSGFGVGLPLSRLYARYLGGSLNLVSLPGYGTSVDLFLTRLTHDQTEVVPDDDA